MNKTNPRKRTCKAKGCTNKITPWNSLHVACSTKCAIQITQAAKEKAERQRLKRDRERIKRKTDLTKEAQQAFNAFIRARDEGEPCICCGQYGADEDWKPGGRWDAGHYLSVGSHPELRFEELNCHKQLKSCNAGAGRFARKNRTVSQEYRERLIDKIGIDNVEWLEGPHDPKHYSKDDLREIKRHYQQKKRELSGRLPGKASRNIPKSRLR